MTSSSSTTQPYSYYKLTITKPQLGQGPSRQYVNDRLARAHPNASLKTHHLDQCYHQLTSAALGIRHLLSYYSFIADDVVILFFHQHQRSVISSSVMMEEDDDVGWEWLVLVMEDDDLDVVTLGVESNDC